MTSDHIILVVLIPDIGNVSKLQRALIPGHGFCVISMNLSMITLLLFAQSLNLVLQAHLTYATCNEMEGPA